MTVRAPAAAAVAIALLAIGCGDLTGTIETGGSAAAPFQPLPCQVPAKGSAWVSPNAPQ